MATLVMPEFNARWSSMTIDRYAALERATGGKVVKIGDLWWQQVHPFFYRPLLPFKKYDLQRTTDGFSRIAAFQHAVEDGQSPQFILEPYRLRGTARL